MVTASPRSPPMSIRNVTSRRPTTHQRERVNLTVFTGTDPAKFSTSGLVYRRSEWGLLLGIFLDTVLRVVTVTDFSIPCCRKSSPNGKSLAEGDTVTPNSLYSIDSANAGAEPLRMSLNRTPGATTIRHFYEMRVTQSLPGARHYSVTKNPARLPLRNAASMRQSKLTANHSTESSPRLAGPDNGRPF